MSDALAPCPFCGGDAVARSWLQGHWVECVTCHAKTEVSDTVAVKGPTAEADAIAAWNRRPAPPPTDDGGAAFAEAVDALWQAGEDVSEAANLAWYGDRYRARVLALHAEAEAAGYARAMTTVALLLADYDTPGELREVLWRLVNDHDMASCFAPAAKEADDDDA